MNVRSFRFYATLAVIVFFPGLLPALPPTGIPAQTQAPPVSVYLPLVSNPASPSGPILLAEDQPHPNGLAVDLENVYWTNCGFSQSYSPDGSIMAYSKSQGTFTSLLSGRSCPDHLYVEPDALYWLEHTWIDGTGDFRIFRWPWSGGQPVQLASYRAVNGSLSLDEAYVYWMEGSGTVMRLPRTGGTPQAAPVPALVFDGADAYWLNGSGDLVRSGKDGSSPVILVRQSDLAGLAGRQPSIVYIMTVLPRSSYLYFTVYVDNYPGYGGCTDQVTVLMRMPKNGAAYAQVSSAAGRADYFVMEPLAYFWGYCTHALFKVNLDSQSVEMVLAGESPSALAEDSTFIYWVDFDNGWVKRMVK